MRCRRGAAGYLTKASAADVLVEAIHSITAGKKYLSPPLAQQLALRDVTLDVSASGALSAREFEVLRLLGQGESVKDIAQSMGLNPKTIANHQSSIKQKLGVETALQLLRIAGSWGFGAKS